MPAEVPMPIICALTLLLFAIFQPGVKKENPPKPPVKAEAAFGPASPKTPPALREANAR